MAARPSLNSMDGMDAPNGKATPIKDSGQKRLEEMGYKQELKRDLKEVTNFCLSFGVLSALAFATPIYNVGLIYGGPASFVYGWPVGGFFISIVALSLAEICSAFPTAGGLYYWSYALAGRNWGPFASWITGWFNLCGQIIGTCSVDYNLAVLIQSIILLSTGGLNGGGYYASKYVVLGITGGLLLSQGVINSFAVRWLGQISNFAAFWCLFGQMALTIAIPVVSQHRASAKTVFTSFNRDTGVGIHSSPYIFALSLLLVHWTILGYDAPAHMSEETKRADRGSAVSLFWCVVAAVITGYAYILALAFSTVDPAHLLDYGNDSAGYAVAQLLYDAFNERYGSSAGAIICLCIAAIASYVTGILAVAINSRMLFGFSRDGAVPFSKLWRIVDRNNVPIGAVWCCVSLSFATALISLVSYVALQATTSISTIGFYISYGIPIFFRITIGHKDFLPGPFHLGRWSRPIGFVAVCWVITVTVIFCLPVGYPITSQTLNYAPVAVGIVLVLAGGGWLFYARSWFDGPNTKRHTDFGHLGAA